VCVVVERPAAIHTRPVPGGLYEQIQLRHGDRPAAEYRDGWCPPLGGRVAPVADTGSGRGDIPAPTTTGAGHDRAELMEVSR
jgi:hypothetical protein